MNNDELIRGIEKIIDVYHKQADFYKSYSNDQNQALYDILRVYEGLFSTLLIGGAGQEILGLQNPEQVLLSNVHNLQDALNTAIRWIYKECTSSESDVTHQLSEKYSSEAADFLVNYADPYAVIVDGYISYSRKQNTGRVEGKKVIFDATIEQLTSFLCDVGERLHNSNRAVSETIKKFGA